MKRIALRRIPLPRNRFTNLPLWIHRILFGLFLLQSILVGSRLCMDHPWFGAARWPDGLLVVLAAAATLASLARQLPGQNVMLAAIIICFLAGSIESIAPLTGIPFGPISFTSNIGQELFHPLPWAMPLVWLIVVLNARGVARLVLRPWRARQNYGLWLIGLSAVLVVLLELQLEPYATSVKHYWLWGESRTSLRWYTAPWVNFVGWLAATILILAFATPSLINKSPAKTTSAADWFPLITWVILSGLFVTGAFVNQLWPAVLVGIIACAIITAVAAWNGKLFALDVPVKQ